MGEKPVFPMVSPFLPISFHIAAQVDFAKTNSVSAPRKNF